VEITEVRIKLMEDASERLQAFCSITFDDCFVIRDLKIIGGANGPFVAMPSRKLTAHCPQCGCKNHLRAAHCNQCGGRLKEDRAARDEEGRAKLYADIAHPINSACREMIQQKVIEAFVKEQEVAKLPGYVSRYDDFDHEMEDLVETEAPQRRGSDRKEAARHETSPLEKPHVQPAQRPQGPHRPPAHVQRQSHQPANERTSTAPKPKGEFGEGIF
jgi:stage V sporulation protein G